MLIGREKICCALIGYQILEPPLLLTSSNNIQLQKSFEKDSGTQYWNGSKSWSKQQRDSHDKRNSSQQVPFYCRLCLHVVLGARLGHRHPDKIGFWQ